MKDVENIPLKAKMTPTSSYGLSTFTWDLKDKV